MCQVLALDEISISVFNVLKNRVQNSSRLMLNSNKQMTVIPRCFYFVSLNNESKTKNETSIEMQCAANCFGKKLIHLVTLNRIHLKPTLSWLI